MTRSMLFDLLVHLPRAVHVLDLVVKATLILGLAGAAAIALRRRSAAARHLAWCLGLSTSLALPVLSLGLPGWSWRVLPLGGEHGTHRAQTFAAEAPALRTTPENPRTTPLDEFALDDDELLGRAPDTGSPARSVPESTTGPSRRWGLLLVSSSWLWTAWLFGVLAVLSSPLAGWIAVTRLTRGVKPIDDPEWITLMHELTAQIGVRRRVLLYEARAALPMTWGWIRPVVLLPAEADVWSVERRRGVLVHELAHVKRFDCLTQAIAGAACGVYWFHPLAWIAARQMRIERERACDDVVLLTGARPTEYAAHLLELARSLRMPRAAALAALAMARSSQLEGRLLAILDKDRHRHGPGQRIVIAALSTAVLMLLPLATLQVRSGASTTTVPTIALTDAVMQPADPVALMTVSGRVLDPSGKPVADAAVMTIVRSKYARRPLLERTVAGALSAVEGRCDHSGRFRIMLPRTTSARQYGITVTATAPGYGMGLTELDPDADPPVADVALRPELVVQGRMSDANGQPAPGVSLRILSTSPAVHGKVAMPIVRPDYDKLHRRDFPAWPGPAVSDDEGRFTLRGLSRDLLCRLLIEDPRFATPDTMLLTGEAVHFPASLARLGAIKVDPGPDPKPIAISLQPGKTIVGRVTYADTGQPIPQALVTSGQSFSEADAEGRFRVTASFGITDRFSIRAQSPAGAPYLMTAKQNRWPKGAAEQTVDVALTRGVLVRGKITEAGTGRPVSGAIVRVAPYPPRGSVLPAIEVPGVTGPDGSFRVAAPPGPGFLVVQGPDDDYVIREFGGDGAMYVARPGRFRLYAHAYRAVDLKPGGLDQEVDLTLRRGVALRGRVIGPDGQPAGDAWVCSRLMLRTQPDGGWKLFILPQDHSRMRLRDGHFVLHGLDPNSAVEVLAYFLDPVRKLGAVARFTGKSVQGAPVTVLLEPCGAARARLVTSHGMPLDHYGAQALATLVITPGPLANRRPVQDGPLFAEEAGVVSLDPVNYGDDFQSDGQGKLNLPALIPGATYRFEDFTPALDGGGGPVIRKEFTVGPGQTLDLGDILIASPRGRNPR